jgi:hypothetical protein
MGEVQFWQAVMVDFPQESQNLLLCMGLLTDAGFITWPLMQTWAVSYQFSAIPLPHQYGNRSGIVSWLHGDDQ